MKELMLRRYCTGSTPEDRDDGERLALCIEGGAMRGVISAGMVLALEQLGLRRVFDAVVGASAGSMNGAYFLAGQAAYGTTIYYENINNDRFIDVRRALAGRAIVDIDFAVWTAIAKEKPLKASLVVQSRIPLHVVATDVDLAQPAVISNFTDEYELLQALRAGATMPVVAGKPYSVRGRGYWDPMFFEDTIPVRAAERLGFTRMLVLLTRPYGRYGETVSFAERWGVAPRIRSSSSRLAAQYLERERAYNEILAYIDKESVRPDSRILAVRPPAPTVAKLERRRATLVGAARSGFAEVLRLFGLTASTVEVLQAYSPDGLGVSLPDVMPQVDQPRLVVS